MKKRASYDRIEKAIIGGVFMPRSYRHIKGYEKEILELKSQGKTKREIGEKLGFTKKQIHNFITRYNESQRRKAAGITLKKKGRPSKGSIARKQDKVSELKYILARKESKIKQLEMENELMRDFLLHTEKE